VRKRERIRREEERKRREEEERKKREEEERIRKEEEERVRSEEFFKLILGENVSRRIPRDILQENFAQKDEKLVAKEFNSGKIPCGFTGALIWPAIAKSVNSVPSRVEQQEKELQLVEEEEANILKDLEALKAKLKKTQEKKKILQQKLAPWLQFRCDKYKTFKSVVSTRAKVETELASSIDKHMENDSADSLSALDDTTAESPKLTFVFNAVGLSENTIRKFSDIDGADFQSLDLTKKFLETKNIPFNEGLELQYLKQMMENETLDYVKHEEDCVVCSCDSENLTYLIEEHEKPFDLAGIRTNGITGRQFLYLRTQDCSEFFNTSDVAAKEMSRTILYFKKIHKKALC